ncbi:MAG: hypothetical protein WCZ10_10485 [Desulfobulbaceae bacterium]
MSNRDAKKNLLQRYRRRFFYLQTSIASLLVSVLLWSLLEGPLSTVDLSAIAIAGAIALAGVVIWVLIVSFPTPFNPQEYRTNEPLQAVLLKERMKTCLLIHSLGTVLFTLHVKNDPPWPKTGAAMLAGGLLWCAVILWPEQRRFWREERAKRKAGRKWSWRL